MSKSKEIRLLNDRLDYYTMEAEDDQFDAEEVIRLLKRLDELEPLPEPDMRVIVGIIPGICEGARA